jgi:hypothetical protein
VIPEKTGTYLESLDPDGFDVVRVYSTTIIPAKAGIHLI